MAARETSTSGSRGTYQIRALERGLDILEAFSLGMPELSIGDFAARTGLPKPTIVRLLSVLSERGYVERIAGAERYRLGVRALEVGSVYLQSTSLEAEARPIMKRLAEETGQTANLGVLDRNDVVHIEVVPPDRPVRFWASIGKREAAHFSGLGKMLLTGLSEQARARYLQRPRQALTPNTIVDGDALREELERTHARGYAIDNEESNSGVVCVAAPIRDGTGAMIAAVSISGLKSEFDSDNASNRWIDHVKAAASEISARMGGTGTS